LGLCKKVFAACGGEIFFGWRHLFPDFALQNQEKDVSIQRIFRRRRRRKPFYTTPYYFLNSKRQFRAALAKEVHLKPFFLRQPGGKKGFIVIFQICF